VRAPLEGFAAEVCTSLTRGDQEQTLFGPGLAIRLSSSTECARRRRPLLRPRRVGQRDALGGVDDAHGIGLVERRSAE
jgi:hypothetical protein